MKCNKKLHTLQNLNNSQRIPSKHRIQLQIYHALTAKPVWGTNSNRQVTEEWISREM